MLERIHSVSADSCCFDTFPYALRFLPTPTLSGGDCALFCTSYVTETEIELNLFLRGYVCNVWRARVCVCVFSFFLFLVKRKRIKFFCRKRTLHASKSFDNKNKTVLKYRNGALNVLYYEDNRQFQMIV